MTYVVYMRPLAFARRLDSVAKKRPMTRKVVDLDMKLRSGS